MVMLTATLTAVMTVTAGLFALCATVFATAGWTAPACLSAGVGSGVYIVLAAISDATSGSTDTTGNDPDPSSSAAAAAAEQTGGVASRTPVTWYRQHDNGFMEAYDGRIHELYGTNETVTMVDMVRGYTHKVWMAGDFIKVKTDFATGYKRRARQAESPASFRKSKRQSNSPLSGRSSESSNALSSATYMAQKTDSTTFTITSSSADALGQSMANAAYELGTWCTSILSGSDVVADIGLTLGGKGYEPSDDEPPCEAGGKKVRKAKKA